MCMFMKKTNEILVYEYEYTHITVNLLDCVYQLLQNKIQSINLSNLYRKQ